MPREKKRKKGRGNLLNVWGVTSSEEQTRARGGGGGGGKSERNERKQFARREEASRALPSKSRVG